MPYLPAQHAISTALARISLCAGMFLFLGATRSQAQPKPPDSPVYSVPVVVSDFELFSVPPQPKRTARPSAATEKPKTEVPLVYQENDVPSEQARRLIDFFAMTLVRTLQKSGLHAAHTSGHDPPVGAEVRGVFAEPDALNRIRRAILGGGSPNARFLLYVGVYNLARPPQPLYQLATEQPPSREYGPVITLNNYVPLAKYELDKNPTEEDVQKICNQIAASLTTLLDTNPNAFSK